MVVQAKADDIPSILDIKVLCNTAADVAANTIFAKIVVEILNFRGPSGAEHVLCAGTRCPARLKSGGRGIEDAGGVINLGVQNGAEISTSSIKQRRTGCITEACTYGRLYPAVTHDFGSGTKQAVFSRTLCTGKTCLTFGTENEISTLPIAACGTTAGNTGCARGKCASKLIPGTTIRGQLVCGLCVAPSATQVSTGIKATPVHTNV
jgi:hypothetical protein